MESGTHPPMEAERRRSLPLLGVRFERTVEQRGEDEATEAQHAELLRRPPVLKLRGKVLTLDEYIRDIRVRTSPLCSDASD